MKDVISIFSGAIAFLDEYENTRIIKDFNMQGCDFLVFDMELEKYFSVKFSNEDWERAIHIDEIVGLVVKR